MKIEYSEGCTTIGVYIDDNLIKYAKVSKEKDNC